MPSSRDSFRRNRVAPDCTSILPFPLFSRGLSLRQHSSSGPVAAYQTVSGPQIQAGRRLAIEIIA